MVNRDYVFVYGTLRKNEKNHGLLVNTERYAEQAWTKGKLYDTGLGFPAMILDEKDYRVYGEVYIVNDEKLEKIDALEGYQLESNIKHYHRIRRMVYTDRGPIEAWVYIYGKTFQKGLSQIIDGDWKNHQLKDRETQLYFAYGSCMDAERFTQQNKQELFQDVVGRGQLKGYDLQFTKESEDGGRADIVEVGGIVEGKVYRINQEALAYLNVREGVKPGVYRATYIDIEIERKLYKEVLTYTVINKKEEVAPPYWYANEIVRGAKPIVSERYFNKLKKRLYTKFNLLFEEYDEKKED